MERLFLTYIYIVSFGILISGCSGGIAGDHTASLALLPADKTITLSKQDPKKLQMVIIADPTGSMVEAQKAMVQYFPGFTQELINTKFQFEIFCSTTSYTGASFGEIVPINSETMTSSKELLDALAACINTKLTDLEKGDERGLEAAKLTWSKIIENKRLDPNAVKLTMIVTNEDDCSRDLGKYPSDDNVFNRCIDQNVANSPVDGLKGLGAFPMTDNGYADLEGLYPEKIRTLSPEPIELFPTEKYINFFKNELTFVAKGKKDSVDELLRQRGHIFAPVIMQPPAAFGTDAAAKAEAKQCADEMKQKSATGRVVMSYGMRYFQVGQGTGNTSYSLCENLGNVLQEINVNVQNEVEVKRFCLPRQPKYPQALQIKIVRQISDVDQAKSVIDRMKFENSQTSEAHQWKLISEKPVRNQQMIIKSQRWSRLISNGNGFTYDSQTKDVIFDNNLYDPYNDKLNVISYEPLTLDGGSDCDKQQSVQL